MREMVNLIFTRSAGSVSVQVVGAGISAGAPVTIGTGSSGVGCYAAAQWTNTNMRQAAVVFGCVGTGPCQFLYDLRTSCAAGT